MSTQGECIIATANGGVSGSFTSGSRTFKYHEFSLSNRDVSETFQLNIEKGYTRDARVLLIAGGGGGGWDGTGTYGKGGGGGAGQVIDRHDITLYPNTYSLRVGHGGLPADADNTNPANRTFNGGNGDYTELLGGIYTSDNKIRALGGEGGYGDSNDFGNYLHGGDSGNGFTGGLNDGNFLAGGGAGNTSNGEDGDDGPSTDKGGDGGSGLTITLPYTSIIWSSSTKDVGGGGGGSAWLDDVRGVGQDGGGDSAREDTQTADDGERYTGGGGGGGRESASGDGTQGGDGILIIYYPITDC